jgi:DNA (cytosine-5)-methyltransferase 1
MKKNFKKVVGRAEKIQKRLRLLSLFSGCGGMDLGFEGGFSVKSKCVNRELHPEWILKDDGEWTCLPRTRFDTVFANDIREDARRAWVNYFGKRGTGHDTYRVRSIVDLVKDARAGVKGVFPESIDVVTG